MKAQANKTAKQMNSRRIKAESEFGSVLRKLNRKTLMFLRWLSISLRFAPGKGRAGAGWLSGTARSATKKVMIAMTIETMRAVLYPQRSKNIKVFLFNF